MLRLFALASFALLATHVPDQDARLILDSAAARMGGIAALRSVQRVRNETMTDWYRLAHDGRPHATTSGYEWGSEFRDYTVPAWRNTRRPMGPNGLGGELVNLVVDSIASFQLAGKWRPLNIAYVDERAEVFTFAPERVLVLAYDAPDATALTDTVIDRKTYRRVRATLNSFKATLLFSRSDASLAAAFFAAAQPNDMGLAGWGKMDVAIWYSRWTQMREVPVILPTQLDIYRVGKPYKRVIAVGTVINPSNVGDSLAMPDSLRQSYLASGRRGMLDVQLDSARIIEGRFATFQTPGAPVGAIKLGGRWLMLEGGSVPLVTERSVAFLAKSDAGTPVAGAIVTMPSAQGGIQWLSDHGMSAWITPGTQQTIDAVKRGWKPGIRTVGVAKGSWVRVGNDSVRVETIDLPDAPGTAVLYVPSMRWMYSYLASAPRYLEPILALAKERGWVVDRVGSTASVAGKPVSP
ncbi:MAG: hypothetical protein H7Z40_01320 [Phycisphaerae bacterium]|nr:hypothetical protein [Gemmatimonadaceae bacterium]